MTLHWDPGSDWGEEDKKLTDEVMTKLQIQPDPALPKAAANHADEQSHARLSARPRMSRKRNEEQGENKQKKIKPFKGNI